MCISYEESCQEVIGQFFEYFTFERIDPNLVVFWHRQTIFFAYVGHYAIELDGRCIVCWG